MNKLLPESTIHRMAVAILFCLFSTGTFAYNVSHLTAKYNNGQVFIAWQSPAITHLQYNVYRSPTALTSSDQLASATLLGYVRDSSSKNLRRSSDAGHPVYYKWAADAAPLGPDKGLYVVTCPEDGHFYYAVTITDLTTGIEDRTVTANKTSLINPVEEHVSDPQPVWQDSVVWDDGDVAQMYVFFCNNQNLPNMPALTNCGSYGYNFYLIRRGSAVQYPLFAVYEGLLANSLKGNGLDAFADVTNCYIMGMDDWIPYPDGNSGPDGGKTTSWIGYHEKYDIYSSDNSIPTSGIVKTYTQRRLVYFISWARKYLPTDTSRVYLIGVSLGGYGALVTADLIPNRIAAVYVVVPPVQLESGDGWHEAMWGAPSRNLKSDVPDPQNPHDTLRIFDLMNVKYMMQRNLNRGLPLIFSVHGKQDYTVGWKDKPGFFDTAQIYQDGGIYYWDQRQHDGAGANFMDSETMPDFYSYATNISFPAFTNCSIDGDPGEGKRNEGDASGSINGYLGWDSIQESGCSYSIRLFIRDFYEGGLLATQQFASATTDVTIRRSQLFKIRPGSVVAWNNFDNSGVVIQSGSFTYDGGPVTIPDVTVNKEGSRLALKFGDCNSRLVSSDDSQPDGFTIHYLHANQGWLAEVNTDAPKQLIISVFNVFGQQVSETDLALEQGFNSIEIPVKENGVYLVRAKAAENTQVDQLYY